MKLYGLWDLHPRFANPSDVRGMNNMAETRLDMNSLLVKLDDSYTKRCRLSKWEVTEIDPTFHLLEDKQHLWSELSIALPQSQRKAPSTGDESLVLSLHAQSTAWVI